MDKGIWKRVEYRIQKTKKHEKVWKVRGQQEMSQTILFVLKSLLIESKYHGLNYFRVSFGRMELVMHFIMMASGPL